MSISQKNKNPEIDERVKKIKKDLPVLEIVRHYTDDLTLKGNSYLGTCPLCLKKSLYVVPHKNIFKCFGCGLGGDPINFIMKFERMNFADALDFISTKFLYTLGYPENFTKNIMRGDVYVLELEGGNFYIGFTQNFEKRMQDHFNGNGAVWTRRNKPLKVLEHYPRKTLNYENLLTEKYIAKYGYEHVRGGDHIFFHRKFSKQQ